MMYKPFSLVNVLQTFSIFLYIICYNFITNLCRIAFGLKPQLDIIKSYCNETALPIIGNPEIINVSLSVIAIKFSVYALSIIIFKNKPASKAIWIWSSVLCCFTLIEVFSVIAFILDKLFGMQIFRYFASSIHIFNLGIQLKQLELVLIINSTCSLIFAYLFLKATSQVNIKKVLELTISTILSIAFLVILKKLVF